MLANTCRTCASKSPSPTSVPSAATELWPASRISVCAPSRRQACEKPSWSCQVQGFTCRFCMRAQVLHLPAPQGADRAGDRSVGRPLPGAVELLARERLALALRLALRARGARRSRRSPRSACRRAGSCRRRPGTPPPGTASSTKPARPGGRAVTIQRRRGIAGSVCRRRRPALSPTRASADRAPIGGARPQAAAARAARSMPTAARQRARERRGRDEAPAGLLVERRDDHRVERRRHRRPVLGGARRSGRAGAPRCAPPRWRPG